MQVHQNLSIMQEPLSISTTTRRALAAFFLNGIGKATLWQIVSSPDFARAESDEEAADIFPELAGLRHGSPKGELARRRASAQIHLAEEMGASIIGYWDKHFPRSFRRSNLSPAIFWFKGDLESLKGPQLTVIGTRRPTAAGEISAARIATAAASAGICIVSGLALGIDSIAHSAALSCNGKSIGILAGGLDHISPKRNEPIALAMASGAGGLLSEFPIGTPPFPANFVTRDTTQACLGAATVLVQSDKRGGSLHASRASIRIGRKLIVVNPVHSDIIRVEPKISATKALSSDSPDEALIEMGFPANSRALLYILRGREQYSELFSSIKATWEGFQPSKL